MWYGSVQMESHRRLCCRKSPEDSPAWPRAMEVNNVNPDNTLPPSVINKKKLAEVKVVITKYSLSWKWFLKHQPSLLNWLRKQFSVRTSWSSAQWLEPASILVYHSINYRNWSRSFSNNSHSIGKHPLSLKIYRKFALTLWVKHARDFAVEICLFWSFTGMNDRRRSRL